MTYLLDTNVVVALLRNQPVVVRQRFRQTVVSGETVAISAVVLFELWYGVARSQRLRENAERLRVFISGDINILSLDEEDAEVAGHLRAGLEEGGTPIGPYDLLIAAQALRSKATLVTANESEFSRVPGLSWQNWAAE